MRIFCRLCWGMRRAFGLILCNTPKKTCRNHHSVHRSVGFSLCVAGLILLANAHAGYAQGTQTAPLITETMPVEVDSGLVENTADQQAVVFTTRIFIPGADAIRLTFDKVVLAGLVSDGSGSFLRMRSTLDNGEQRLNAIHILQWRNTSAFFNGDEVIIELVAQPGTGLNRLVMSSVQAEFAPFTDESICGDTDDREISQDPRMARLLPVGCTGWMINDCNHCFLTAGHCARGSNYITLVEFNVPLSNHDRSLNHPPPEDQYAPDNTSRQSNGGQGIGNDYAYFGVFPNPNTGLTPYEAQGDAFETESPPPVHGQQINITGYGVTSPPEPNEWTQVQKDNDGPYVSFSGTTVSYQVDTSGGNSGSPVFDLETGKAIGIHTHGGCNSSGGNFGTGLNHPGLQAFLDNPLGVCAETDCLADFNDDGLVDSEDVILFVNAWSQKEAGADINEDGKIDVQDITLFLNLWSEGC